MIVASGARPTKPVPSSFLAAMIPATLVPWPTVGSVLPVPPLCRKSVPLATAPLSCALTVSTPVSMTATLTPLPLVSCHSWSRTTRCSDQGVPLMTSDGNEQLVSSTWKRTSSSAKVVRTRSAAAIGVAPAKGSPQARTATAAVPAAPRRATRDAPDPTVLRPPVLFLYGTHEPALSGKVRTPREPPMGASARQRTRPHQAVTSAAPDLGVLRLGRLVVLGGAVEGLGDGLQRLLHGGGALVPLGLLGAVGLLRRAFPAGGDALDAALQLVKLRTDLARGAADVLRGLGDRGEIYENLPGHLFYVSSDVWMVGHGRAPRRTGPIIRRGTRP